MKLPLMSIIVLLIGVQLSASTDCKAPLVHTKCAPTYTIDCFSPYPTPASYMEGCSDGCACPPGKRISPILEGECISENECKKFVKDKDATCPKGQIYTRCRGKCRIACNVQMCPRICAPGCNCPEGQVLLNETSEKCVPKKDCIKHQ